MPVNMPVSILVMVANDSPSIRCAARAAIPKEIPETEMLACLDSKLAFNPIFR